MLKLPRFRIAALAVLALGTFQLSTAQAAGPAGADPCEEEAIALGMAFCDEMTGGDWETAEVWCNAKGQPEYVECNGSAE
jgi:hypothetical protein